jgi:hypothetical protein
MISRRRMPAQFQMPSRGDFPDIPFVPLSIGLPREAGARRSPARWEFRLGEVIELFLSYLWRQRWRRFHRRRLFVVALPRLCVLGDGVR